MLKNKKNRYAALLVLTLALFFGWWVTRKVEANKEYPGQPGRPCWVSTEDLFVRAEDLPIRVTLEFNEGCPVNRVNVSGEYPIDARLTVVPLSMTEGVQLSFGRGQGANLATTPATHFRDGVQEWEAHPHSAILQSGTIDVFIVDTPETRTWVDGQELVCLVASEIAAEYCSE